MPMVLAAYTLPPQQGGGDASRLVAGGVGPYGILANYSLASTGRYKYVYNSNNYPLVIDLPLDSGRTLLSAYEKDKLETPVDDPSIVELPPGVVLTED